MQKENGMRRIMVEKVTVNMGIGNNTDELKNGQKILEKITGMKPVQTLCTVKQPKWNIRPGIPIGLKVTLRKKAAVEFLQRALGAKGGKIGKRIFDNHGNLGFGIHEYIDLPGVRYDPSLGVRGFDVLVTLQRLGFRVKRRKMRNRKVGKGHVITKDEAVDFVKSQFGAVVE